MMNKSTKFKKLNKTIKNKSTLKKCEKFCKNDYMLELNKSFKKSSDKFRNPNIPYKSPTKQDDKFLYNTCKKTFCNTKCEGFDFFGNKQTEINFKKKIKNGFLNAYSRNKIELFKKKGALSGCTYDINYNISHK
jgi:hypothetical protein